MYLIIYEGMTDLIQLVGRDNAWSQGRIIRQHVTTEIRDLYSEE